MNFNHVELSDIAIEVAFVNYNMSFEDDEEGEKALEYLNDDKSLSDLEIVEEYATINKREGLITDRYELSDLFDSYLDEIDFQNTDDAVMINEMFNSWTDGLYSEGRLHEEQLNNHEYCGKYS
jgi:hypothetical protein